MEVRQSETGWNAEEWNWDSMLFLAQPASQRGVNELMSTNHIYDSQRAKTHWLKLSTRDAVSGSGLGSFSNSSGPHANVSMIETSYDHGFLSASIDTSKHGFANNESLEDVEDLTLKLGGPSTSYLGSAGNTSRKGKRSRLSPSGVQHPACQVEGCPADLSFAKDYHRRHKVCEHHSKAEKVSIGHLLQRFCQQCSRFHPMTEFDEGKRSCRRRLAGHNRRRRKTQPEGAAAQAFRLAEQNDASKSTELLSLLKLLCHLQGNYSERRDGLISDQDLLVEFIKSSMGTTPIPDSHGDTSGDGLMYNRDSHHLLTATKHQSHLDANCRSLGDHASGPALGGVGLSPLDPQMSSSSTQDIESLASFLRRYINDRVPAVSKSLQATPSFNVFQNQSNSTNVSSAEKTPQRTSSLSHRGSLPGQSFDFGKLSHAHLESGKGVEDGFEFAAIHESPQQSMPTCQRRSAPYGDSDIGRLENVKRNDDLHIVRNDAAINFTSNASFARLPSFPSTRVEQESTYYAACNQSVPTCDAQPKSISLNTNGKTWSSLNCSGASLYADIEDRTGRISFKLFDKNPGEFPPLLRTQILEWLSQIPSEMESYIKPGCVVLTLYLSMPANMWEELCRNLHISLERLLNISNSDFWCKGRILVQVQEQLAYIVDGEVQDVQLVEPATAEILTVRPLAVVAGQPTKLILQGHYLSLHDFRIFCAYQGKYALQNSRCLEEDKSRQNYDVLTSNRVNEAENAYEKLCFGFSGGPSDAIGRCFIEVEDGEVGGGFVPLIVADDEICTELRTLEDKIDHITRRAAAMAMVTRTSAEEVSHFVAAARTAIETEVTCFCHDLGWIFQKAFWRKTAALGGKHACFQFSTSSMKRVMAYAVEHDWCTVTRRLLDILFDVNFESALEVIRAALCIIEEVNLLHIAVRRICRPMVDQLLAYEPPIKPEMLCYVTCPDSYTDEEIKHLLKGRKMVFRPDMACPLKSTPLHIAASMSGAESMIDALTSDPYQIGLHAWNYARDAAGQTPLTCALANRNFSYVQMVWKKVLQTGASGQLTMNMPSDSLPSKQSENFTGQSQWSSMHGTSSQSVGKSPRASGDSQSFTGKMEQPRWGVLHLGKHHLNSSPFHPNHGNQEIKSSLRHFGGLKGTILKPFLLSVVAIAAISACACILLKGPPQVDPSLSPFLWKNVNFGNH